MAFKKIIYICVSCIAVFCISKIFFDEKNMLEINSSNLCQGYTDTEFIFNFKDLNITVKDPFGMVKRIYIYKNEFEKYFSIKCKDKKRVFLLKNGAILKTLNDSIDVEKSTQKLHGYMGIFTKNNCYYVDKKGYFWGNIDSRTMDNAPKEIKKYCN